jgi:hypothetical protein
MASSISLIIVEWSAFSPFLLVFFPAAFSAAFPAAFLVTFAIFFTLAAAFFSAVVSFLRASLLAFAFFLCYSSLSPS